MRKRTLQNLIYDIFLDANLNHLTFMMSASFNAMEASERGGGMTYKRICMFLVQPPHNNTL